MERGKVNIGIAVVSGIATEIRMEFSESIRQAE
jgi:hypothetical protein